MSEWRHKDQWQRQGKDFLVVVSRHSVESPSCLVGKGPHRWCVYGYVYPTHRLFAKFNPADGMWEQPTPPMHGGCTFFKTHRDDGGSITSFQFGCDYSHLHDDWYTNIATKAEAASVFADAEALFSWLEGHSEEIEGATS